MKSKKSKRISIVVGILVVALILNAIITWGIVFEHRGGFKRSTTCIFDDVLTENCSGEIWLGENTNNPIFAIPFVFWIYGIESPPYAILLDISEETVFYEKIVLELVSVEYVDGEKIDHSVNWEGKFKKTHLSRFVDSKLIKIPCVRLIDKLPVTVDRRQSCNIRLVGYFINKEGDNVPFNTMAYFEYRSHDWIIYPGSTSF